MDEVNNGLSLVDPIKPTTGKPRTDWVTDESNFVSVDTKSNKLIKQASH